MHTASSSSLSRATPALIVFGAHAILIYAVAMSLGYLEVPQVTKVLTAHVIEEPEEKVEVEPVVPVDPGTFEDRTTIVEVPRPDPAFDESIPADSITVVAVAEPMNPAPVQPAIAPDVTLAVTRRVDPPYPPTSRRLGEEGSVTLRVLVDERGAAADVQVAQSSGYTRLDDAAVQAVRRWNFRAATQDSRATSAWTRVKITFALNQ